MTCAMCCLHDRQPIETPELQQVAKEFGMRPVLPPKGYYAGRDTLPTETWYLRIKHETPSWNGETHGRLYYSLPRWRWRKDEETYWRGMRDLMCSLERALANGYVKKKRRERAQAAMQSISRPRPK